MLEVTERVAGPYEGPVQPWEPRLSVNVVQQSAQPSGSLWFAVVR